MYLLTGFLPYGLFRTIVNSSMNAYTANQGLFSYRQVKPIDTLVSRCIVECIVNLFGFVFLGFVAMALGFGSPVHDMLLLMWTLFLLVWFSFCLGLFFFRDWNLFGNFSECRQRPLNPTVLALGGNDPNYLPSRKISELAVF